MATNDKNDKQMQSLKDVMDSTKESNMQNEKHNRNSRRHLLDLKKSIQSLSDKGMDDLAVKLKTSYEEATSKLEKAVSDGDKEAELSANEQLNKLKEAVGVETEGLEKLKEEPDNAVADDTLTALQALSRTMQDDTQHLEMLTGFTNFEDKISALEGTLGTSSNENTEALRAAYEKASYRLQWAIDNNQEEAIKIAEEQLAALYAGAEDEEKRREAKKLNEEANSTLFGMAKGIENLGTKFDKISDTMAKGGLLGGIAAIAFAIFNPEKFVEILGNIRDTVNEIVGGIVKIYEGDIAGGFSDLSENAGTIAGILLGAALMFGGPILGAIGSVVTGIRGIMLAFTAVKAFMMTTLLPALAPILLPIAAIALAVVALGVLLDQVGKALGFNGIGDMLKIGMAYIQDGLSMFYNMIVDIANGLIDLVQKYGGKLASFLGFELPNLDQFKLEKAETGRAEVLKGELREAESKRRAEEELEASKPKAPEILPPEAPIKGFELSNMSEDNSLAGLSGSASNNTAVSNVSSSQTNNNSSTTYIMPSSTSFTERMMNNMYHTAR